MVPAGQTIVFDVEGETGGWFPVDDTDLRAKVLAGLTPFFTVTEVAVTRGSTLSNVLEFQWYHWNYRAAVTLTTRVGYAALDDVRAVVAHAFYDAGGAMPTVTSPTYQESQGAGVTTTGPSMLGALGFSAVVALAGLALVAVIMWKK